MAYCFTAAANQMTVLLLVVYDRNHLFGLGPKPKLNIWP